MLLTTQIKKLAIGSIFALFPTIVAALEVTLPQNPSGVYFDSPTSFSNIIGDVASAFGSIVFAFSIFIFIYAGFLYMTAGDDEKRIESAKGYITYGIIGLIVVILAWSIPAIINSLFRGGFG